MSGHLGPPIILRNQFQGFLPTYMLSYLRVMIEYNYSLAEVHNVYNIDLITK